MTKQREKDPKVWIKIKRGLVVEPKHRQKVGSAIWLYLMLIDAADWETGIVDPYKDEDMAAEMAVSKSWIRKQRRVLEEFEYITTKQLGPKGMQIAIMRWVNPKSYSGEVKNTSKKSATSVAPSKAKGDTNVPLSKPKSDTESDSDSVTESITESDTVLRVPSIRSGISDQVSVKDSAAPQPKAGRPVNPVFDAVAEHVFGIDPRAVNGDGGRIAKIAAWLKKAEEIAGPPDDAIRAFKTWYQRRYIGISLPRDLDKFKEHWAAFKQGVQEPMPDYSRGRKR